MNENEAVPPPLKPEKYKPSIWFWVSAVSVIFSFVFLLVLLLYMVPVFVEMFLGFGAELPKPTQLLIGLSAFVKSYLFLTQLPLLGLVALTNWVLYELDKRKQTFAVVVLGNTPPAILIVMVVVLFLPIVQFSSVIGS